MLQHRTSLPQPSVEKSLGVGEPRPVLFKTGTASGILLRSGFAGRPASRLIDLSKRLRLFPLLLHRFARRRIRWAIGVRNPIKALTGIPGAPSEKEKQEQRHYAHFTTEQLEA